MNTFLGMEKKILRIYSRDYSIADRRSFEQRNNPLQVYRAKYAISPNIMLKRYFEITKLVLLGGIYVNLVKNGDLSNVTFCKT